MTSAKEAYVALSLAPGLGPTRIRKLSQAFGGPEGVMVAKSKELGKVPGLPREAVVFVSSGRASAEAARVMGEAKQRGITILTLSCRHYPPLLREIYDPPPVLYLRGDLPPQLTPGEAPATRSVALVGTRRASSYGLRQARTLAREAATAGTVVVSGLALGIDASAHRGALEAPAGTTVAVLGSGVDDVAPRSNLPLAVEILRRGGALLSEYPPGTPARPGHFPARNRLISGLSQAVVVVEGGRRSGALITAMYGLEQGRTVGAVPGRVDDPRAEGTLALLRDGACLIRDTADLLAELGWPSTLPATPSSEGLSATQGRLLEALSRGPKLVDELLWELELTPPEVMAGLAVLELHGLTSRQADGRYSCC